LFTPHRGLRLILPRAHCRVARRDPPLVFPRAAFPEESAFSFENLRHVHLFSFLTCNHLVAYYILCMEPVFKALADKSRRRLLDILFAKNGQTLNELSSHLSMSRQAVTKHLLLLEKAHLVVVVWRGRAKFHYLNPVPIHQVYDRWIGKYDRHRLEALSELKRNLESSQKKKGLRHG